MSAIARSACPINLSVEVFGDRWTLLILRDMIFAGRRHYRELLTCDEGISTNILANRLRTMIDDGLLTKSEDPHHKQKAVYSLTEASIALVPAFVQIGAWGSRHRQASVELSVYAEVLHQGGPAMWEAFMDDLREIHLGAAARRYPAGTGPSFTDAVRERLG